MFSLSGMSRPTTIARPLHQRGIALVPMCAAKPSTGAASKGRCTRKTSSSSTETDDAAASTSNGFGSPASAAKAGDRSLHRLHGTSDTLRALLERRAERQKEQMQTAPSPSTAVPLAARAAAAEPPAAITTTTAPTPKNKVKVRFWLPFRVEFGQSIVVVGGSLDLGNWVLADGLPLAWSEGDMWNASVDLPAGTVTEYKYVVVGQGGHAAAWQQGNNSVLALRQSDDVVEVYDNWGGNPGAQVLASGAAPATRENRLLSWATELEAQVAGQRQELRRARMELVAAQEEARIAREESKKLKMALAKSETDRIAAVANLKQAETVNQILQTQLKETTMSFNTALETAMELLTPKTKSSSKTTRSTKTSADTSSGKSDTSTPQTPVAEVEKSTASTSSGSGSTRRI